MTPLSAAAPSLTMASLTSDGQRMNRRDLHAVIAYATHVDGGVRTLWAQPDRDHVLIQSAEPPRGEQLGHIMTPISTAARALDYRTGGLYRLIVDANPVITTKRDARPTDDYSAWLATRLRHCATVLDCDAQPRSPLRIKHPTGGVVTLSRAIITATATVTDPVEFARLAMWGIGNGRAYGLGLMLTQEMSS